MGENVHAVEMLTESQAELQQLPHAPTCIYENIEDFFTTTIRDTVKRAKTGKLGIPLNFRTMLPMIQTGSSLGPD
eukprot:14742012-Alexandrium_andersonii.AAC.1